MDISVSTSATTENSSDSDCLEIDERRKKRRRKKNKNEIELEKTIENTLSKCDNITPDAAKKMLLKLVRNEHVMALVRIKAEEEEAREKTERSNKLSSDDNDDNSNEIEMPSTPKLTRFKSKLLNKNPLQVVPLKSFSSEPNEEVVALIHNELKSDEDDDEYQPHDTHSDDDLTNTTMSDMDSQPSTPGSALLYNDDFDSPVKDDFKVPRTPLTAEEQENISRRTRSKLDLQTTAIETIENTFIPPDISKDMYEFDDCIDNDWKVFLNEFMMPLTNAEEDDDGDPEYIATDPLPADKEELRPVRVSKKELNQLISELLEDQNPSPILQLQTPQRIGFVTPTLQSPLFVPMTPPSAVPIITTSTPCLPVDSPHIINTLGSITSSPNLHASMLSPCQNSPTVLIMNSQNQLEVCRLPDMSAGSPFKSSFNIMNQLYYQNGMLQLPQYQSIVIQVPTIDLLQNKLDLSSLIPNANQATTINETIVSEPEVNSTCTEEKNLTDDKKNKQMSYRETKWNTFEKLNSLPPPKEQIYEANAVGFTAKQYQTFEKQMRIHCQLLSLNYMQFYANPKLWQNADEVKLNLINLKKAVRPEVSPFNSKHVIDCIELCEGWERELTPNNEHNKKYMQFLYDEIECEDSKKYCFRGRFHNRFMEYVINSKAIIYPQLLPDVPFRTTQFLKTEPTNGEIRLIAFGLEHSYKAVSNQLNRLNPKKDRKPTLGAVCRNMHRHLCSFRSANSIMYIVQRLKNCDEMNPVKYFFKYDKAPPLDHNLIDDVDVRNVAAPKNLRRGLLPKTWDKYVFSYERVSNLQLHPYVVHVDETPLESIIDEQSENNEKEKEHFDTNNLTSGIVDLVKNSESDLETNSSFKIAFNINEEIPNIIISFSTTTQQNDEILPEQTTDPTSVINQDLELSTEIRSLAIKSPVLKVKAKSCEEKQNNLISILKKVTDRHSKTTKKKTVQFLLPALPSHIRSSSRPTRKCSLLNPSLETKIIKIPDVFHLKQKFFIVIERYFTDYIKNLKFKFNCNAVLKKAFNWTKTIDVYLKLLNQSIMISKKHKLETTSTMSPVSINSPSSSSGNDCSKSKKCLNSDELCKKLNRKLADNRAIIMDHVKNNNSIEKDCSYAYNFLERVKKTLTDNKEEELLLEFQTMLTTFDPDYESVPELYNKMETLLMPSYPDLVDIFLTFLMPEHAAEIGRFFEHFVLTNMTKLLQKLTFYFNKQPSHIKKIYSCLNDLSNESDLTMERLKSKILPLLKGNQLLIDWFLQLFEQEKPTESAIDEHETLYIKKSLSDSENSVDNHEELLSSDLLEIDVSDSMCGVKYLNGKLQYRGRIILPAKISFLAYDSHHDDTTAREEIGNQLCVHELRKYVNTSFTKPEDKSGIMEKKEKTLQKVIKKRFKPEKYKLCDAQTLKAHAIRLNPLAYARNGEKFSDVAHLLTQSNGIDKDEKQPSPKKTASKLNPKKMLSPGVVKKIVSPCSSSNTSSSSLMSPSSIASPSRAVQTAKKLKFLIEQDGTEKSVKKRKTSETNLDVNFDLKSEAPESIKSPENKETSQPSKETENKTEKVGWTRDEDKIILEEIKKGYSSKDELLKLLNEQLNRDSDEVTERYEFLLEILLMMKKE
ncbi:unnamed protein product [Diamesa serratosioi]